MSRFSSSRSVRETKASAANTPSSRRRSLSVPSPSMTRVSGRSEERVRHFWWFISTIWDLMPRFFSSQTRYMAVRAAAQNGHGAHLVLGGVAQAMEHALQLALGADHI